MSENRRLLVTGGAGFIGSNFIEYVVEKEPDWEIVNLDLLTYAGHLENLSNIKTIKYTFIQGDICDYTLVKKIILDHQIDLIVHFAAESHVDRSIEGPGAFVQTNIVGTYNLLEAARNIWKSDEGYVGKRFHHVSTDEVFGMLKKGEPAFTDRKSVV
mgnify:FL=1